VLYTLIYKLQFFSQYSFLKLSEFGILNPNFSLVRTTIGSSNELEVDTKALIYGE
jgi:hypothetical protein